MAASSHPPALPPPLDAATLQRAWPVLHGAIAGLRDGLLPLYGNAFNAETLVAAEPERFTVDDVAGAFGLVREVAGELIIAAETALSPAAPLPLLVSELAHGHLPDFTPAEERLRAAVAAAVAVSRENVPGSEAAARLRLTLGHLGNCVGLFASPSDGAMLAGMLTGVFAAMADGDPEGRTADAYRLVLDRWSAGGDATTSAPVRPLPRRPGRRSFVRRSRKDRP